MANYKLTRKAVQDLNNIWVYTFNNWSEEQADKYYFMLLNSCKEIGHNPELGKNYDSIMPDLFGLKVNRHIIFYRQSGDAPIEITRILHGMMDLKNNLSK